MNVYSITETAIKQYISSPKHYNSVTVVIYSHNTIVCCILCLTRECYNIKSYCYNKNVGMKNFRKWIWNSEVY